MKDAFDLGSTFQKPSATAEMFEKQFEKFKTNSEKDAFRIGVFQEIVKDINKISDNQDLVKKIFFTPDLRKKYLFCFKTTKKLKKNL